MKKLFLFIGLFCCFLSTAQDANNKERVFSEKKAAMQTLNQRFSAPVLNAYQENSKSKIEDLFSYFQMLTDANLDTDLKKEVVKNINQLFNNQNPLVVDFTSQSLDKIPLQLFIQKLLISEPILFSISDETNFNSVDYTSWKTGFSVKRTKSGIVSITKVVQKVFFYETVKVFGDETKVVFSTLLGEM